MVRMTVALLAIALLVPQSVSAGGMLQMKKPNIKIGKIEFHPYAGVKESYDSNIYLVPRDKPNGVRTGGGVRGSWITDSSLGLNIMYPMTKMHQFAVGYGFQALTYTKQGVGNDAIHQNADAAYMYKGPMGISGKVWNKYINTTDPAFSELITRSQRYHNTVGLEGEYAPGGGKLFAGASFDHQNHKYLDGVTLGPRLNRYEQSFGLRGGYRIMPKTRVYAGWSRKIIHYSIFGTNKNSKSDGFNFGIEGKIAPKLTGQIQTGISLRDYDDSNANRTGYTQNWIVSTKLTYNPIERTKVMFGYSRTLNESTFATNRFGINNNITLDAEHKLPYKLIAKAGFGWTIDKYPESSTTGGMTANRRDDTYTQKVGVDYAMQEWMLFGLAYEHRERNSVFTDQFNHERHITSIFARVTF
ncbi:MAG: outer membrane beta-barrel protein [Elusimicrobiota bacterium]